MSKKVIKIIIIIYLVIVSLIGLVCFYLTTSERVSISYNGFAVDSSGILYLGKEKSIEKYDNGSLVGKISPQTSRSYEFTIQNNDTVLVSTASKVYELDLSGNILNKREDVDAKFFHKLQRERRVFITKTNEKYTMTSHFGRVKIASDNKVIYQMPMLDYVVKLMCIVTSGSLCIFIPVIIKISRKNKNI